MIFDFDLIINRIKLTYGLDGEHSVAKKIGLTPTNLSMRKGRASIPFKEIVTKCYDSDLNFIFKGSANQTSDTMNSPNEIEMLREKINDLERLIKEKDRTINVLEQLADKRFPSDSSVKND